MGSQEKDEISKLLKKADDLLNNKDVVNDEIDIEKDSVFIDNSDASISSESKTIDDGEVFEDTENVEEASETEASEESKDVEEASETEASEESKDVEEASEIEASEETKDVEEVSETEVSEDTKDVEKALETEASGETKDVEKALETEASEETKDVEKALETEASEETKDVEEASETEASEEDGKKKKKVVKKRPFVVNLLFFTLSLIWIEVAFHYTVFEGFDKSIIYPIFFAIPLAVLFSVLTSIFGRKVNGSIATILLLIFLIWTSAQYVYYDIFQTFLVIVSIGQGAGQAADFGSTIMDSIFKNIVELLIIWVPLFLRVILGFRVVKFDKTKWYTKLIGILVTVTLYFACILSLFISGTDRLSPYDLYYNSNIVDNNMTKLGVATTTYKDIKMLIQNKLGIEQKFDKYSVGKYSASNLAMIRQGFLSDSDVKVYYNVMDIDFDEISDNTDSNTIKDMNSYFSSLAPTNKNEYTGKYAGYNLIYISAESFSKYVINEDLTPTLYKMYNEGFRFNNFYCPLWYLSTIDGEYVNCLSQIPKSGDWSFEHASKNSLPFALGNQLNQLGYNCSAYHDHDSFYYDRTVLHPTLGYKFKALDYGLNMTKQWPESDLEMVKLSDNDYMKEEPFHTYYMTVSGHLPYDFYSNAMSIKNEELVEDLDYSEKVRAYLAANIELDRAMEELISDLDSAGTLDHTLFVITPDHYPYNMKDGSYNELVGEDVENDKFELYRTTMLIWSPTMTEGVDVDKYCSSLDVLPTIENLMGIEYDSRLLAGRDIFSDSEPLIMFKDRSFITDKIKYNAISGNITYLTDEKVSDLYVNEKIDEVNDRFTYSYAILDNDYFDVVLPELDTREETQKIKEQSDKENSGGQTDKDNNDNKNKNLDDEMDVE